MSPSSHGGNLHVERYIGSCLISQLARPGPKSSAKHSSPSLHYNYPVPNMGPAGPGPGPGHGPGYQAPPGWTGMPMITVTRQRSRKTADYEDCSLSRLAMHTQGAPLILSGRYRRNNNSNNGNNSNMNHAHNHHHHQHHQHHYQHQQHTQQHLHHQNQQLQSHQQHHNRQSSNSKNSEISVRDDGSTDKITKTNIDSVSVTSDESSGSAHSENYIPRIIKPRKRRKKDRKPMMMSSAAISIPQQPHRSASATPTPACPSPPERPKVETPDEPRLHHDFSELLEEENSSGAPSATSDCQCRYCDPSGQIWDAGQLCYSLFLTPPDALQRSWSDEAPSCPVPAAGVIGAGRSTTKDTWRAAPIEVSSEIVTSLNGLRDLEIRFYSHHKDDNDDYTPLPADIEKGSDVFLCSGALCSI